MKLSVSLLDRFIILLLTTILLVDMANGILIRAGFFSIASLVKTGLLCLMLFRLAATNQKGFLFILFITFLLIPNIVVCFLKGEIDAMMDGITVVLRYLLLPVSFFYGLSLIDSLNIERIRIIVRRFVFFNLSVLLLNLLLGLFGFGYEQYEGGIGSVGYFFAGNEVSAVLIVLFCFALDYVFINYSKKKYVILSLVLIFFSLIKATKVGIVGTLICVFVIPLMHKHYRPVIPLKLKYRSVVLFMIGAFLLFVVGWAFVEWIQSTLMYERLLFFYERSDGWVHFLTSGRNEFVGTGMMLYGNYGFFELLFGKGTFGALQMMIPFFEGAKSTEVDFFDFLFQFGLIGVLIVYGLHFFFIYKSFVNLRNSSNIFSVAIFVSNLLILGVSFAAGHVFNAGMVNVFIGFLNSNIFVKHA